MNGQDGRQEPPLRIEEAGAYALLHQEFLFHFPFVQSYRCLENLPGKLLKSRTQRRVFLLFSPISDQEQFVLKFYFFPLFRRWGTLFQSCSIATKEYKNLKLCQDLGIPVVPPMGYGWRCQGKFFLSCFLITSVLREYQTLRQWLVEEAGRGAEASELCRIFSFLGRSFRRVHTHSIFFRTVTLSDILIHSSSSLSPSICFLDIPLARQCFCPSKQIRQQARDIGNILAGFFPYLDQRVVSSFYESYFPDPCGHNEKKIRSLAFKMAQKKANRTFFSQMRRRLHRLWMGFTSPKV
ncbi:MAG: hypothetical protein D6805_06580 [Planctomycetota bacterium]|nr:MAG: hypothetical protein D6805_06580 [Planctomycetota bacterium]